MSSWKLEGELYFSTRILQKSWRKTFSTGLKINPPRFSLQFLLPASVSEDPRASVAPTAARGGHRRHPLNASKMYASSFLVSLGRERMTAHQGCEELQICGTLCYHFHKKKQQLRCSEEAHEVFTCAGLSHFHIIPPCDTPKCCCLLLIIRDKGDGERGTHNVLVVFSCTPQSGEETRHPVDFSPLFQASQCSCTPAARGASL